MYPESLGNSGKQQSWDLQWKDVEAGASLAAYIDFDVVPPATDVGDHAGEAHFQLEGTGLSFVILARVDYSQSPNWVLSVSFDNGWNPWGVSGSKIQLHFPPDTITHGRQAQFTLTGNENVGYWVNTVAPVNWMHNTLSVIGDRKLKYVCMPGSHDAGMSTLSTTFFVGNEDNTITQIVDIYGQLLAGSRWFDLRPCLDNGGKSYLCHVTVSGSVVVGGLGQTVDDAISNINQFMHDYPGELVILDINSDAGFDIDNADLPRLSQDQWTTVADQFLNGLNNMCDYDSDPYSSLGERTINSIMGYSSQGCVLPGK
jgi:hypothetical protein